jgi:hypothetical protein
MSDPEHLGSEAYTSHEGCQMVADKLRLIFPNKPDSARNRSGDDAAAPVVFRNYMAAAENGTQKSTGCMPGSATIGAKREAGAVGGLLPVRAAGRMGAGRRFRERLAVAGLRGQAPERDLKRSAELHSAICRFGVGPTAALWGVSLAARRLLRGRIFHPVSDSSDKPAGRTHC